MKNLIRKILNEEIDKRQQYLDKVVNHIVKGSTIDHEEEEVRFPILKFTPLTYSEKRKPYGYIKFSNFRNIGGAGSFDSYCKEIYGLNEEETKYVWERWLEIMKDKVIGTGKYNNRWWVTGNLEDD